MYKPIRLLDSTLLGGNFGEIQFVTPVRITLGESSADPIRYCQKYFGGLSSLI